MTDILLATVNAKYIHASFGLRYLLANMGELSAQSKIIEFTLDHRAADIAEQLLAHNPKIIGLGVYIWNSAISAEIAALIKLLRPDICLVVGGPEVSYEHEQQVITQYADHILTGWGDIRFPELCQQVLAGAAPSKKIIEGGYPELTLIKTPYHLYSDEDIAHRLIYVEASRGCPFKCEFCLSALDKTAWPFDLDAFMSDMETLYKRGARHFKFVDRTFNLKIKSSIRILEFFLEHLDDKLFLHFEVIPDHLPDALKLVLQKFPAGCLQFEIGIQTFNPAVQSLISRRQDNEKSKQNIQWLRENTQAHIHVDLIAGLPGENIHSLADGFDQLYALNPQEIQMGILKRLKGSIITRHTDEYHLRFSPTAPYQILSSTDMDFTELQRINRFARYWDLIANSGRFKNSLPVLISTQPFASFMKLTDWLYQTTGQTHRIALIKLFEHLYSAAQHLFEIDLKTFEAALAEDYQNTGMRERLSFLDGEVVKPRLPKKQTAQTVGVQRQSRHLKQGAG